MSIHHARSGNGTSGLRTDNITLLLYDFLPLAPPGAFPRNLFKMFYCPTRLKAVQVNKAPCPVHGYHLPQIRAYILLLPPAEGKDIDYR